MRKLTLGLLLLAGIAYVPKAHAQDAKVVLASIQPFEECAGTTNPAIPHSQIVRSGCFVVPKSTSHFPGIIGWKIPPMEVQNKVYPPTPAMLQAKPVYKNEARRLVVSKRCINCQYIAAQSEQGKQLSRQFARRMGIQASSIIGFFVPFPFSLAVNTATCAAVSVGFDAKEYREDYKEEPTQEQYGKSFGSNLLYCSPIGGFITAIENKNPIQFLLAGLGFSSYFVNLPQAVGYAQQGLPLADYAVRQRKPAVQEQPTRAVQRVRPGKKVAQN